MAIRNCVTRKHSYKKNVLSATKLRVYRRFKLGIFVQFKVVIRTTLPQKRNRIAAEKRPNINPHFGGIDRAKR